jgi:peptide/nickel transport system ATP-binding protein
MTIATAVHPRGPAPVSDAQLSVEGLATSFSTERGTIRAVRDVSFAVGRGETLALVGESGSGKSVTSLSIMGLLPEPAGRIVAGTVRIRGKDGAERVLTAMPEAELCRVRGHDLAMIFQEPMTSLNPVQRVGDQIIEAILLHEAATQREASERVVELLARVDIPDPMQRMASYPHQMSGGMRQRVMIAMALACNPALLIADEPTTALDVTVQAQVLALMRRLQTDLGMSILFITHNLGVVAEIASRVAVMYGGLIVEEGRVNDVFRAPRHPYTRGLLHSLPRIGSSVADIEERPRRRLQAMPGNAPDPGNLPPGCPFAPRCAHRMAACEAAIPALEAIGGGHLVRCVRWRELPA